MKPVYKKKGKHLAYNSVVGCAVSFDIDCNGCFLNADGSTTPTSDVNSARILLFSRMLAEKEKPRYSKAGRIIQKIRLAYYRFFLWLLFG